MIGRANNNSIDLNRDFPDLDRLLYAEEEDRSIHNNHLMDQIRRLDHPVTNPNQDVISNLRFTISLFSLTNSHSRKH